MGTKARFELPQHAEEIIAGEAYRALVDEIRPDDFEDAKQEGRISVFKNLDKIRNARKPGALCRTIVRRAIGLWLRRELRHEHEPLPAEI